ncbi:MAG: DUF4153 domain-containing protein [Lachnospiraceae bacterium]|nr:DUF4153 domain-containing protein [Lachnospiraceae bacterium]
MNDTNHIKGKIEILFEKIKRQIGESFRDYPLTLIAIVIASFMGAILVDYEVGDTRQLYERIVVFCLLFSVGEIFTEEYFKKDKIKYAIGSVISALISFAMVYVFTSDSDLLFGGKADTVIEICARGFAVYGITTVGMSVFHMFKRTEEDFEEYCVKAFIRLIKVSVIYGLFAIGLGIIVFIFNELIFDTDEFIWRVEVFLIGGIFAPICVRVISSKNDKPDKFAKVCFNYALLPMLLIAFSIIYMYIIKIFATDTVPSNRVFYILTFLFVIGTPIWTVSRVIKLDKVNEKVAGLINYLPYVFVPFIILQCFSIGIRIHQYGVTVSRYMAIIMILIEVIYFVLYLVNQRGKKETISYCLPIAALLAVFVFIIPGISYDDAVIRSQLGRIHKYMKMDNMSEKQQSEVKSAYYVIKNVGYKGEKVLLKEFSKEDIELINSYNSDYYYEERNTYYVYREGLIDNLDVSNFKSIRKVYCNEIDADNIADFEFREKGDGKVIDSQKVDLSKLISRLVENSENNKKDLEVLEGAESIEINETQTLVIDYINWNYDVDNQKTDDFYMEGYILEK